MDYESENSRRIRALNVLRPEVLQQKLTPGWDQEIAVSDVLSAQDIHPILRVHLLSHENREN